MSSQLIQHKIKVFNMAHKILWHLVLGCLSDFMACHSALSPYSRHLGFLFLHISNISEPCTSVPFAWHALPQILRTCYSSFKTQYKWHLIKNSPSTIQPTLFLLHLFILYFPLLVFIIIEPSVHIITF